MPIFSPQKVWRRIKIILSIFLWLQYYFNLQLYSFTLAYIAKPNYGATLKMAHEKKESLKTKYSLLNNLSAFINKNSARVHRFMHTVKSNLDFYYRLYSKSYLFIYLLTACSITIMNTKVHATFNLVYQSVW